MTICNDDHDDICYGSRYCPLCEIRAKLQNEIDDLNREIEKIKEENKK